MPSRDQVGRGGAHGAAAGGVGRGEVLGAEPEAEVKVPASWGGSLESEAPALGHGLAQEVLAGS